MIFAETRAAVRGIWLCLVAFSTEVEGLKRSKSSLEAILGVTSLIMLRGVMLWKQCLGIRLTTLTS